VREEELRCSAQGERFGDRREGVLVVFSVVVFFR
jgi:hypothetical protein